jgi:hypothetical protein
MSSSTSSSDASAAAFLRAFAGTAACLCLVVAAVLLVLDPYDTGRLTPLSRPGVPETAPRMASASRVRDTRFNAAIIGNSTIQLVNPERLKSLTGLDFVQLSVPGTGPMEQAALVERLFSLRGAGIGTLVVGLDGGWCDATREGRTLYPFPFWMHDGSDLVYAASLFRWTSLEFLPGRVLVLLGRKRRARPDGYWDFAALKPDARPADKLKAAMATPIVPDTAVAAHAIRRIAAAAPAGTRLVFVHPPVHITEAAAADGSQRRVIETCKVALRAAVGRSDAMVQDFWIDEPQTRNAALFFDATHYRTPFAERIEQGIAAALARPR